MKWINFSKIIQALQRFKRALNKTKEYSQLPALDVEFWIIFFGLRTTYYGVPTSTRKLLIVYHLFCLLALLITAIRLTAPLLNDDLTFILGDISGYIGGKRAYYLIAFDGWAWHAFIQSLLSFIWRDDNNKFEWLRPYVMCNKRLQPEDISLSNLEAIKLWKRTKLTMTSFWVMYGTAFILANFTLLYVSFFRAPAEYINTYARYHAILVFLWVTYDAGLLILALNLFHSTCYYIVLRFSSIEMNTQLLLKETKMPQKLRSKKILDIIREHNKVTLTIENYNTYWNVFSFGTFLVYTAIVCTWLYLGIYEKLDEIFITFYVYSLATITFFSITFVALSAAMISKKAGLFYKSGNSLMKLQMSPKVRMKLSTYLRFKVGSKILGIHPLGIFTFTYETYYVILANIIANFLLVAGNTSN